MPNRQIAEVFPPGEFIKEELDARGRVRTSAQQDEDFGVLVMM